MNLPYYYARGYPVDHSPASEDLHHLTKDRPDGETKMHVMTTALVEAFEAGVRAERERTRDLILKVLGL